MFHYLIFIFCFLFPIENNIHEHYVSITTAKLNNSNNKLQVSIQLTAHDIEYYFETENNIQLHLGSDKENSNSDELLSDYFKKHLLFSSNKKPIHLVYLGKEIELNESLWVYMEGYFPKKINSIRVKNDILIQSFENQQNIIHLEGIFKESFTFSALFKEHTFHK